MNFNGFNIDDESAWQNHLINQINAVLKNACSFNKKINIKICSTVNLFLI